MSDETLLGHLRQLDLDARTGKVRPFCGGHRVPVAFANSVLYADLIRAFRSDGVRHFTGQWQVVEVRRARGKTFERVFVVARID